MRNVCTKDNRLTWYATALVVMGMVAGPALGDSIDDAEAKRRGVAVEVVQLEHARARIAELEAQVTALQKQLATGTQPNRTTPTAAGGSPATTLPVGTVIEYGGRPRTQAWLDATYKQFGDKIALVDGKYYDVGRAMVDPTDVDGTYLPEVGGPLEYRINSAALNVGDLRTTDLGSWKILSVLASDEALIIKKSGLSGYKGDGSGFPFHVKGFSTKNLADGHLSW